MIEPRGTCEALASIDDGGLRAIKPLTSDFTVDASGAFVGE